MAAHNCKTLCLESFSSSFPWGETVRTAKDLASCWNVCLLWTTLLGSGVRVPTGCFRPVPSRPIDYYVTTMIVVSASTSWSVDAITPYGIERCNRDKPEPFANSCRRWSLTTCPAPHLLGDTPFNNPSTFPNLVIQLLVVRGAVVVVDIQ